MKRQFEIELDFFIGHQYELVEKFPNKFLAIKGTTVLGAYNTPLEALSETRKQHEIGTFMIQPCRPGPEAYTVTISSTAISL